ncbi:unnamed protein product [Polarella glacialis]|uniref:Uncharacterized protein n=1 Tax=Polarella glacialis TaxID=89957 RepID=A0A813DJH7_POLGL|nr:unnamed protein product [Polarella glacialis]
MKVTGCVKIAWAIGGVCLVVGIIMSIVFNNPSNVSAWVVEGQTSFTMEAHGDYKYEAYVETANCQITEENYKFDDSQITIWHYSEANYKAGWGFWNEELVRSCHHHLYNSQDVRLSMVGNIPAAPIKSYVKSSNAMWVLNPTKYFAMRAAAGICICAGVLTISIACCCWARCQQNQQQTPPPQWQAQQLHGVAQVVGQPVIQEEIVPGKVVT